MRSSFLFSTFGSLLVWCGAAMAPATTLPAQLIPKTLDTARAATPTRPAGAWQGTAQEKLPDGRQMDYTIDLQFEGADDALRLQVRATVPVPTEDGQKVTVAIRASYRGRFAKGDLRMDSEQIEVKVVETGEVVPSTPQKVEARLVDGVLSGRVGGDDDGWTTFTARPAGANKLPPRPAAEASWAGVWRGTCRERGPDGGELSYPIRVEFAVTGNELRADVAADLKYPTQNGPTPIEYRATFRGQRTGNDARLQSERVQVRLVELGRTETAPAQEFTGRLENGVLRARIGQGELVSEMELQREATTDRDRPAPVRRDTAGTDETVGEDVVTPRTTEAGPDDRTRRGERNDRAVALPAAYRTVSLQRQEVRDETSGGVVSHTLRVPAGWRFRGGPEWRAKPDNFVNFVGEVSGPDGEQIRFLADHAFTYSRTMSSFGNQDSPQEAWSPAGEAMRRSPSGPGEVAVQLLIPHLRPNASDVQLVDAGRLPEHEAAMRQVMKPTLDMIESLCQQSRRSQGVAATSDSWFACERSRVRYREDGRQWEEEVRCVLIGMHGTLRTDGIGTENGFWTVHQVQTFRAPAGELDARLPLLLVIAGSTREAPRWSAAVAELRLELSKQRTEQLRIQTAEMGRQIAAKAAATAQLADDRLRSWRQQQDSLDRVHKANVQSLGEVHDFRDAEGHTHTVTNHFDRAFRDPDDNLILTNDPNYRPAGDPAVNRVQWQELQRVDPWRDGR